MKQVTEEVQRISLQQSDESKTPDTQIVIASADHLLRSKVQMWDGMAAPESDRKDESRAACLIEASQRSDPRLRKIALFAWLDSMSAGFTGEKVKYVKKAVSIYQEMHEGSQMNQASLDGTSSLETPMKRQKISD